jgi:hypothetical protein
MEAGCSVECGWQQQKKVVALNAQTNINSICGCMHKHVHWYGIKHLVQNNLKNQGSSSIDVQDSGFTEQWGH